MSALFIMIGASLLLALGFLFAFIWAVKKGQYEDDYSPSVRILFDNPPSDPDKKSTTTEDK
ncbi:MAG: cbb3-type cytochrome oxidase assembly protein CcoS [Flavobacteriales bacterium]